MSVKEAGMDAIYTIRAMTIEDYDKAMRLWKSAPGVGLSGEDDSRESIAILLKKNPDICFVAETNGEITGTIMAGNDGRRGHIYHLTVAQEQRNKGIGKNLLESVEKTLKRAGIRKICLVAFTENETGNRFWDSNGYKAREDLTYRDRKTGA
jgi:ribosomal protein S18 acetylase RimI-like enzyme